ncbi:MAG: carboxypeptidase-like regulatory domain-containing protein [Alphaproteobacteria bacterium]
MTITGTIHEVNGGPALPGVGVQNTRTGDGAYSDADGRFLVYAEPGDSLRMFMLGYKDSIYPVQNETVLIHGTLAPDLSQLNMVEIVTHRSYRKLILGLLLFGIAITLAKWKST